MRNENQFNYHGIVRLAKEAYENYPFYKWFYESNDINWKKIDYKTLPIVTKKTIIEYQKQSNMPYYKHKNRKNIPEEAIIATTTGTSGRPLEVLFTPKDAFRFFSYYVGLSIIKYLYKDTLRSKILAYFLTRGIKKTNIKSYAFKKSSINILIPDSGEDNMNLIYDGGDEYGLIEKIPLDKTTNKKYLQKYFTSKKPTVIVDTSGQWIKFLVEEFDLNKDKLKLVISYEEDEILKKELNNRGIGFLRVFGCQEGGCLGTTCEYTDNFHVVSPFSLLIRDKSGVNKPTGRGELIFTTPYELFPFINYSNGDIIDLNLLKCKCGYVGQTFQFLGRHMMVKVPNVLGMYFDIQGIINLLEHTFKSSFLITYIPVKIKNQGETVNIIAIFIEDKNCIHPKINNNLSRKCLIAGGYKSDERFVILFPVIKVPEKSIPSTLLRSTGMKKRRFFNGVSSNAPKGFESLSSILQQFDYYLQIK